MNTLDLKSHVLEELKKESPEIRAELIKAHAYTQEERVFQRELTKPELDELKDEYVKNNMTLAKFEDQLQKIKEEFKNKMNPLKLLGQEYMSQLRSQKVEVEGMVYELDDQENGLMISVDIEGNVLDVRPLRKSEKQLSINSESRQAVK